MIGEPFKPARVVDEEEEEEEEEMMKGGESTPKQKNTLAGVICALQTAKLL